MKARLRPTLLVCSVIALAGLVAAQPASAGHQSLKGNRIALFGPAVQTCPASEPAFVHHGWAFPWANLSADERRERLDDAVWRFELFVDGVPVPLERFLEGVSFDGEPVIAKRHGVQFEAGAFSPGTYTFTGVWYGDSGDDDVSEVELTRTVTVVFTP